MDELLKFLQSENGPTLLLGGIIALALLSTSVVTLSAWHRYTKANGPWGRLAHRTGLTLTPGRLLFPQRYPVVEGLYNGYRLKLTWWSDNRDGATRNYTVLTREVNHDGSLHLSPANLLSKLGQALGWNEVQIGDDTFDRKIDIRSSPDILAAEVLDDPELRHRIMKMKRWSELRLSQGTVNLRLYGVVRDADRLVEMFDLTNDLVRRLEQVPL